MAPVSLAPCRCAKARCCEWAASSSRTSAGTGATSIAPKLDRDLRKASDYVFSLLPEPLTTGLVRAEWRFVPSAELGGDAFGYYWLDPSTFVFYLVDVSGHGAGSAMHSVSVMNVLRQRALPDVDFRNPAAVLTSLNARFPMDVHGGLFFTMWYGVYDAGDRTLRYASAGHHPAYLVPSDRQAAHPLGMSASMVGAFPGYDYKVQQVIVPADGTCISSATVCSRSARRTSNGGTSRTFCRSCSIRRFRAHPRPNACIAQ